MIIGGEHYFTPGLFFRKSKGYINNLINDFQTDYQVNFTFGGYFSLLAIIDTLKPNFDKNAIVLLPSYLCPSILQPFKLRDIKYKFYKVDDNLFIDTDYLLSIIDDRVKAVLFIDYFGATQVDKIQIILNLLKLKKIEVIQDVVQCLQLKKDQFYGDYIFNSFRKFFPFEGSILLSKKSMNIQYSENKNSYIKPKRIGQILRFLHVRYKLFNSKLFLFYLNKAEDYYYTDGILKMPKFNTRQLNKYNIDSIVYNQKYYYQKLFHRFNEKVPLLLHTNNFVPLGFVNKVEGRDAFRKYLFENNIYAPIHWIISDEIDKTLFHKSNKLSLSIITLPIIRLNKQKFKYLEARINKYFTNENIS